MSRTSFWLKAAGASLLVAALGALAALAALKVLFPEPKIRALVLDQARKQLGRDVRLESLDVGLRGLTLRGLEIAEQPGFSAGAFVRAERIRVRPSWSALLRRRLVVAEIALDAPTVRVVKMKDGSFNFSTLGSTEPVAAAVEPSTAPAPGGPAPELNVRSARVTGGAVVYVDRVARSSWSVGGLDLDVTDFALAGPFGVRATLRARGAAAGRALDAKIAVDGRVDLAHGGAEGFRADVARLTVEQGPLKLTASGKVARLDAPEVSFDAALSAGRAGLLKASGSVKSGEAVVVDVKAQTPDLDTRTLSKLMPKAELPALNLPAVDAALSVRWGGEDLTVSSLRLSAKQGSISGSGVVRRAGSAKPAPDLSLLLAFGLPAFKVGDLPVRVSSAVPPSLTIEPVRIDGRIAIKGDDVRLQKVVLKVKEGTVTLDGVVAKALAGAPRPDVEAEAELSVPALTDSDLPFPGVPAGLSVPPSRWQAKVAYASEAVRVRSLRVQTGGNDVAVEGAVADPAGRMAFDLLIKCRSFVLEELTQLTPLTRDMKLTGKGFFALSVTGTKEKPAYAGKLQFSGLGATVADLPLSDFTGTASMDDRHITIPNLTGKVADGTLALTLGILDYATAPFVQVTANLDRFDLGRYLDAKAKFAAMRAPAAAPAKPSEKTEKPKPIRTHGTFDVGTLLHPNANVEQLHVAWELTGVGPDKKGLNGDAQLSVGNGKLLNLEKSTLKSKLAKALIFIFRALRVFKDFNNIALQQVVGDYAFKDGVVTLRKSEIDTDAAQIMGRGTIDLAGELLDLVVTTQAGKLYPVDTTFKGTFDDPKIKTHIGKAVLDGLLQRAIGK